jgi:hypothetical protein
MLSDDHRVCVSGAGLIDSGEPGDTSGVVVCRVCQSKSDNDGFARLGFG